MIYLYHVRKCGGRSLIFSILEQFGDARTLYTMAVYGQYNTARGLVTGWNSKPPGNAYFAWAHTPFDFVEVPPGTFTITILRDSAQRVLSYYAMLRMYQAGAAGASSVDKTEMDYLGNNLYDFIHRAPRWRLLKQLYMFSDTLNIDQAAERIGGLSFHFRLENYSSGIAALSTRIGFTLNEYRVDEPGQNDSIGQRVADELPEARDELLEMLEPEYKLMELLGYGQSSLDTI